MRHVVAISLGLMSGFLIYMTLALIIGPDKISVGFVFVTFFGGWALSSYLLVRNTSSVSRVFSRGFLLGAAEWLAIIPAGIVVSGKAFSDSSTDAERAGAAIGAGCFSVLTGGVAIGMALACMIGFAVTYFIGREMRPETPLSTKKCPECAETIQREARRCRHCGAVFETVAQASSESSGGAA